MNPLLKPMTSLCSGVAVAAALLATQALSAADGPPAFEITAWTADCGGGTSTGGDFSLTGTVGQADASYPSTGDGFELAAGFHYAGGEVNPCPADLDGSNDVGFGDILTVIGAWGPCGGSCPQDLNGNGVVDFADILVVIGAWGACP